MNFHPTFITEFAYLALLLALVLVSCQVLLPFWGSMSKKPHIQLALLPLAPSLAVAQMFAMLMAFFGLMAGFLYNDFSLLYVVQHSNSLLPWYYKLSATWGGHEGSLLLWVTILAIWGALVAWRSGHLPLKVRAKVLVVLASIQWMMLLMLIVTSSPFKRTLPNIAIDGMDLNPLLQDPGLIVHPPILYMGYVGMAVPFAFCMAALWSGRLDSVWTRWCRPWAVVAWAFLTLGIALGSWWAYYELGWGGWWFWDPVENASLMPWLAATALIHSLAVTEQRGIFKAWTIMLAIFAFALSLLGTFLVRSGVITSVHSFAADPTRGLAILIILASVIGAGLLLFAWRGWQLNAESQHQLKARETLLMINNLIILVATLVVLLGTLYPIIADAFGLGQVSVGAPYFNALFVPLTWLLLLVMGVGSVLRWKHDKRPLLGVGLAIGLSSGVLTAIISYVLLPSTWLAVSLNLLLVGWVLGWMLYDLHHKTRHSKGHTQKQGKTEPAIKGFVAIKKLAAIKRLPINYWGMQLAHLGILCVCLGVALTSHLSIEKDVAMTVGDKVSIQKYEFTMTEVYEAVGKNYTATAATMSISKNGQEVTQLHPEKRMYEVSMMPMTEAAISANIWRDLYVALGEPLDDATLLKANSANKAANQTTATTKNTDGYDDGYNDGYHEYWAVRIYVKPFVRWIWLGAILMAMGGLLTVLDKRYRVRRSSIKS